MIKEIIVFFIASAQLVNCKESPTANYKNSALLIEPDLYYLYWNHTENEILFEIHVKNDGWAGFGISPSGSMPNSNAIITWINKDGSVHFTDRHLNNHLSADINENQEWFILSSSFRNGYLITKFTRKIKICDETNKHLDIKSGMNFVVFSFGKEINNTNDKVEYHGSNRGSKALNLIGSTNKFEVKLNKSDLDSLEAVEYRVNVTYYFLELLFRSFKFIIFCENYDYEHLL